MAVTYAPSELSTISQKWFLSVAPSGDSYPDSAPLPHQCPHGCKRDRHPEPLTRDVASMYDHHQFREGYDPAEDDSPIMCVGANYHGPNRAPEIRVLDTSGWHTVGYITEGPTMKSPTWLTELSELTYKWALEASASWVIPHLPDFKWGSWVTAEPEPLEPCETPEGITVTFDNRWQPWERAMPGQIKANLKLAQHITTHAYDIPTPQSPGYDFSQYATSDKPYYLEGLK